MLMISTWPAQARFHSQPASDLEVMKFYFCSWKTEQEEDGSIKVDREHAMKEMSDKQVDIEDLKGTLKIRSFGDAAFGNIPDKDPSKDKVHSTVGKCVCVWKERGEPSA